MCATRTHVHTSETLVDYFSSLFARESRIYIFPLFFPLLFLSFSVSRSLFFFVRFCPFVLSFPVWFLDRLLRFYFRFPAFLGSGFCYSVISSRRYTPPALLVSLKYAYSPCVLSLLALLTYLYFFLLFLTFFDFDLGIVCFRPAFFLWVLYCLLGFGFCCDSFSISYIYVCILIRTYADLTFLLSEVYDLFQLLCIVFCFICFPPEWGTSNFPLQSYWSLSCDHGLLCSDELMSEQQLLLQQQYS